MCVNYAHNIKKKSQLSPRRLITNPWKMAKKILKTKNIHWLSGVIQPPRRSAKPQWRREQNY